MEVTNFVTRTIKNGRVKINGNTYKPDEKSVYDGRLDGTRYVFGVYTGLKMLLDVGKEETSKILVNTAASEIINGHYHGIGGAMKNSYKWEV